MRELSRTRDALVEIQTHRRGGFWHFDLWNELMTRLDAGSAKSRLGSVLGHISLVSGCQRRQHQ